MKLALAEAEKAIDEGEIPVGCVLVYQDQVIGKGSNKTNVTRNGSRHCEIEAFEEVLKSKKEVCWQEVELYVTCEPCIMCAGAISLMGVKSVFYGCSNDKFGGCGSVYAVSEEGCGTCSDQVNLTQQGFKCRKGLFAKEAITMLQNFYIKGNARAPKPHRKLHP